MDNSIGLLKEHFGKEEHAYGHWVNIHLATGYHQLWQLLERFPDAAHPRKRDAAPLRLISWLSCKLPPHVDGLIQEVMLEFAQLEPVHSDRILRIGEFHLGKARGALSTWDDMRDALISEITLSGLPNPAAVVLRLMTMFLQRLPLPRLVHFIDLVLPQMVPSDSPSQRDSDDAMCSLLLRNHQQALSEGQQRQPLQVELGKLFSSHSGMLHVSMNVNSVPFLLFASASDFSLSPVADFKSTKSVNTAKQNVVLGLKKGYTILLHFRVGSIQYHAVLYLIKSTPGRKGGQDQHKLWKHVVPSHLEFAWLPHDLALTFCANALDKDPRRLYAMPDSAIDSNVQAAWVTVDQIYWIGECKSAHELDVFVNMPIERLRVGCGLQCTLPLHPLGPSSRPKLFAAAVNLLKFAMTCHFVDGATLAEDALAAAIGPVLWQNDVHVLATISSLVLALLEGRTDLPISGVFGAGKTRAAAIMVAGLLTFDPTLRILILTKENTAAKAKKGLKKGNFFRNFDDCEPMQPILDFFNEGNGPLVTLKGQIMPLAPLLRTRGCSNFGICHSSWTLYQPHALVWDYNFWGGKQNFAQACRLSDGKIPFLGWDRIVPPPFLDQWKTFLDLLKKGNRISRKFDETIAPLLPLFGCNTYQVPFRVLREQEVMNLSGLGSYWVNTSIEDSERLPENAIRDMCGNSFHPALISSALGSNSVIREWINNKAPGPDVPVANQCEALSIYTELCDLVATEIEKKKIMSKQAVVRDLPMYPIVEKATSKVGVIQIEPATIVGFRPVEVSKTDKKRELAIEAAIYVIEQQACVLFEQHGIRQYFEAFRADIRRPFTCQDYVDLTFGPKQSRVVTEKITPFSPNRPVQSLLDRLQKSFENFEEDRGVASFLTCLVDATALKQPTTWPVGHVVIVQNNRKPSIFYVGAAQPKLLLVVMWNQLENPWLGVLAATAYAESLTLGRVPIVCQEVHEVGCLDQVNQCFVECLAGQWSIRFDRHIASQGGCPICFLNSMGVFDFCPWHSTSGDTEDTRGDCTRQILHLVAKYQTPGTVNVLGYIDEIPLHCRILMFHVLPEQHWKTLRSRICYLDSPFLLTAHMDIATERCNRENTLAEAFGNQNLPSFLFHHFLLRAAGSSDILNTWLQPRSLL